MKENNVNWLDPEREYMKLLRVEEPYKYEIHINQKYANTMPYIFWSSLSKYFKKFKFCNDMQKEVLYIMKEVK